jgi:hypothetical protein
MQVGQNFPYITLLPLKVLMPWALGFFTYSSIKKHFTSIVGLEGNRSYNCQSLQLRNNGFWIWGGLATANPSKTSLSQFWTMSTFHMARALLTETMLYIAVHLSLKSARYNKGARRALEWCFRFGILSGGIQ